MGNVESASEEQRRGERILTEVVSWPGVSTRPEQYGGTEFRVGKRSLGHVHGGWQADIPFPRALRDRLVAEGRTGPHHIQPDSTWTTLVMHDDADAEAAIELLRLNYDRAVERHPLTEPGAERTS